jgi:hypothetical protein
MRVILVGALLTASLLATVGARADTAAGDLRRADFERVDDVFLSVGTRLCGRGAFVRQTLLLGYQPGDFFGRAVTLFGPLREGAAGFAVRHRPSGIVVNVYFGRGQVEYGGGLVIPGELPKDAEPQTLERELIRQLSARATAKRERGDDERRRAEAEAAIKRSTMAEVERVACEHVDPPGFARVAGGLEALIAAARLTDFEGVWRTREGRYRIGVRRGKPFEEKLIDEK